MHTQTRRHKLSKREGLNLNSSDAMSYLHAGCHLAPQLMELPLVLRSLEVVGCREVTGHKLLLKMAIQMGRKCAKTPSTVRGASSLPLQTDSFLSLQLFLESRAKNQTLNGTSDGKAPTPARTTAAKLHNLRLG